MVMAAVFTPLPQLPAWKVTQVVAADATSGAIKWTSTGQVSTGGGDLAVSSQGLVALAYNCCLQIGMPVGHPATEILRETDGAVVGGVDNAYLLASANGLLYGNQNDPATGYPAAFAVDPTTSSVVWSHAIIPTSGLPAVSGRSIIWSYTYNDATLLSSWDPLTGCACVGQWTSSPAPQGIALDKSDPVVAGGLVFWVTTDGTTATLIADDANTGRQVAVITLPTSSAPRPVVANGQVYLADGTSITALGLP
jgi:hypothetical protein